MIRVLSVPGWVLDVDALEVAQVDEPLAGPLQLLQREEVALHERDLAAEDAVLAAGVAA